MASVRAASRRQPWLPMLLAGLWTGGQCFFGGSTIAADAASEPQHLQVGDPSRRMQTITPVLDGIVDTRRGELIDRSELTRRLTNTRVLFIGEEHTNGEFHRVQLQAVEALHAAGRKVILGLEMFPWTPEPALERWRRGELSESEFLDQSRWYEVWSHHWGHYRELFLFARTHGLGLVGLNAPREVVRAVRANRGFETLTPQVRQQLPPVIAPDAEHRRVVESYFDPDDPLHARMSSEARDALYLAQLTWDAAMGWQAGKALSTPPDPREIIVVLIGAGHVAYDLGAARHVPPEVLGRVASLIPVTIEQNTAGVSQRVSASYAQFVWGVPKTVQPTLPVLGVSLMGSLGREATQVIQLDAQGPAASAGVQVGDVLRRLDQVSITSSAGLQRQLGEYQWGDSARLDLERAGQAMTLTVFFRRRP